MRQILLGVVAAIAVYLLLALVLPPLFAGLCALLAFAFVVT